MSTRFQPLIAQGVRACLDLAAGHVRSFEVERGGRTVAPFHTAPWVDDPDIAEDQSLPGNLRTLSVDFFCAPFGLSDLEPSPPHGWPANSAWSLVERRTEPDGASLVARLDRPVMGAEVSKILTVRNGHPALYQRHRFRGGHGGVPVANHAMVALPEGGRLSFSPKSHAETPATALETDPARGRSALAYPARTEDCSGMPTREGGLADLTRYPFAERHEDFVTLVEARSSALGWFAALRSGRRDLAITLKSPVDYPVTLLWFSNGGRDYPPWNGRHTGVLGIEDGRTYAGHGHKASLAANAFSESGTPTSLTLDPDGVVEVRNVLVALPVPAEWSRVAEVRSARGCLVIEDDSGSSLSVPFDTDFLMRS